jgi:hypothetical protein
MNVYSIIGEAIFFLVGLPLFAFQTFEILQATIQFLAEYQNYK